MPMRPVTVRMDEAGFSRWVLINTYTESFGVGLGLTFSDGATLTCSVQHTFDDLAFESTVNASRVVTDLTVNKVNHGLGDDDWVVLMGTPWDGEYAVASVVDADNFVLTVTDTGPAGMAVRMKSARVHPHDSLTGISADADGNYQFPPVATRLLVSAYTDGFVDFQIVSGGK